ncbi:MAG: hypothetical protein J6W11_01145 [Alphaproteobacteria bacterium]|nr:hypothetical protein [Alphaproteobacteria bacterium]MBO7097228.1 hypothetical protein [Alphaproteobacteria bacterium]
MITNEQAAKMFEGDVIEALPTDMKRIVIPAFGFAGATDQKRQEWGADGPFMEDVKGMVFKNPKDDADQVLKQKDGVLLCYDAPGRKEKIESYLAQNPNALSDSIHLKHFIKYLTTEVVNEGGKADLWDSDTAFAAGLTGAPAKEDIKPGKIFSGVKKKEMVQAVKVPQGTVFEGAEGQPQTADKGGAYIIKDSKGIRLIQADAFAKAYQITKMPQQANSKVYE